MVYYKFNVKKCLDNCRNGYVQFDDVEFYARMMDLPTIVETHKTFHKKNLYKTGDIHQVDNILE